MFIQVSPEFTKLFHVPCLKYQVVIKTKAYKRNIYDHNTEMEVLLCEIVFLYVQKSNLIVCLLCDIRLKVQKR